MWLVILLIPSISALHYLPPIMIDASNYLQSDRLIHDFRSQFHPISSYRCLLQIESKYVYLNPSCQLFNRISFKSICLSNVTLKFEMVLPQNTTIFHVILQFNQSDCQRNHRCQFEKNPYRMKLKENNLYKNFLHIQTLPSCSSANFLLSSTNSKRNFDYFSLNSSTGYLSLLQSLDYESITTWKLVIQAHDRHHIPFYTYVIIDVDDINDCPPVLSWNFPLQTIQILNETDAFRIEIAIYESKLQQKNVIIANLIASDLDSPFKFDLKINSSEHLPFTIDGPYGDSTYVLLTNAKLDREEQDQYIVNLILQDHGKPILTSNYQLIIYLLDNNDNPPKFERDIYYVDIQENNFLNTTLLQIFANDSDIEENGHVTYELKNERTQAIWMERETGIIRTNIQFDYEEMKVFSFNVTAMDHPQHEQQLNSSAMVIVNIIDQNDNIPKFPVSSYEFSIYENNAPHSYIGEVLASDADSPSLTYTLDNPSSEISSLFSVSPSDGKLYAQKSLDREQSDHYIFHLVAFDGYHTSSRIEIQIKILDLNDEIPRFLFPNDHNDTLILDRRYWNENNFICQIEIHDNDLIRTHTLLLIYHFDQLKNYDYLTQHSNGIPFDSKRFFLDQEGRLFFNDTMLNEGVYYLAFKLIDERKYYDEKLLKLIVVNQFEHVQSIVKQYDYLGLHLNNRFAYLQYRHSQTHQSSKKYFLLIIFAVLSIILIGITSLFISLIRRKTSKRKQIIRKSTMNSNQQQHSKGNLQVTNCCDYNNDSALTMLNRDLYNSSTIMNDNCCLLETISERESYDQPRNQTYSSWALRNSTRPEASAFNQLCSLKRCSDYAVAVVSSMANHSSETPVSSDDGFCGSSDISDPAIHSGHHLLTSYGPVNLNSQFNNGIDPTRRVRFNLLTKQQESMLSNQTLREMYITRKNILEKQSIHSTVV